MKREQRLSNSDRAEELKLVREIPDGEFNRQVEVEATEDGLRIDDYIVIPWDWIHRVSQILATSCDPQKISSPAQPSAALEQPQPD